MEAGPEFAAADKKAECEGSGRTVAARMKAAAAAGEGSAGYNRESPGPAARSHWGLAAHKEESREEKKRQEKCGHKVSLAIEVEFRGRTSIAVTGWHSNKNKRVFLNAFEYMQVEEGLISAVSFPMEVEDHQKDGGGEETEETLYGNRLRLMLWKGETTKIRTFISCMTLKHT